MRGFLLIFVIALVITTVSTPLVRRLAIWSGFVDAPDERKVHTRPTPLLGGVAIAVGAILTFILLVSFLPVSFWVPPVIGTLVSCLVIILVGLVDDRFQIPAWAKLFGQIIAALILIYSGVQVRLAIPSWANITLTLLWVLGITNAVNFLDNMDGLSAGVAAVASAFILLLAVFNEQHLVAALSAALLGACLAFLRYNFKPATIFMGDAGSMFIGFLLSLLCIQLRFPDNVNFVTWMVPVFIMGLPIFDMALVVVSRSRRGLNPLTTAGKDHFSHRLVMMGYSQREAVLILYLVSGVFGMAGLFVTSADVIEGYTMGFVTAGLCLIAIWRLEKVYIRESFVEPEPMKENLPGETRGST